MDPNVNQELEKIRQKTADLEQQIAETGTRIPFSYEALLDDPAEVKRIERTNPPLSGTYRGT